MSRIAVVTITALLAIATGAEARATFLTIDQFSAGTTDLNITAAAPPTQSANDLETGLAGVVGGSREVSIEKLNGLSGGTRNVTGTVDAVNEEFLYISGNGVTGALTLSYNANGSGLNIQLGLIDSILLNFIEGDYSATRTIPVTVTITAANNEVGSLTQTLAVEQAPTMLEFKIADFSNLSGLALTTNAVKAVQFQFTPTATSADFTLGTIQVVPEPSAYALATIGAAAVLAMSRRRRA